MSVCARVPTVIPHSSFVKGAIILVRMCDGYSEAAGCRVLLGSHQRLVLCGGCAVRRDEIAGGRGVTFRTHEQRRANSGRGRGQTPDGRTGRPARGVLVRAQVLYPLTRPPADEVPGWGAGDWKRGGPRPPGAAAAVAAGPVLQGRGQLGEMKTRPTKTEGLQARQASPAPPPGERDGGRAVGATRASEMRGLGLAHPPGRNEEPLCVKEEQAPIANVHVRKL